MDYILQAVQEISIDNRSINDDDIDASTTPIIIPRLSLALDITNSTKVASFLKALHLNSALFADRGFGTEFGAKGLTIDRDRPHAEVAGCG